jgi:hypothetical protein
LRVGLLISSSENSVKRKFNFGEITFYLPATGNFARSPLQGRRLASQSVLKPQEGKTDNGYPYVRVEDNPGVAGCEVAGCDDLISMDSGGAKKKTGGPGHRGSANAQPPRNARKPITENPRLANPTSAWNGLCFQPMNSAAMLPKKTWKTKL